MGNISTLTRNKFALIGEMLNASAPVIGGTPAMLRPTRPTRSRALLALLGSAGTGMTPPRGDVTATTQ